MTHSPPLTLIIMAKAPRPGYAKTRMIPALGADGAAELARELLVHTLHAAVDARIGQVEVCVDPPIDSEAWQGMEWPLGLSFSEQGDGDLGERMARASDRALASGQPVLLIGTDCVQMSPALLRRAASQLMQADAVIHPARDGGYALLGLRRHHPSLLSNIPWSTDQVCALTQARLQQWGDSFIVGDLLQDLDDPEDLRHWPRGDANL